MRRKLTLCSERRRRRRRQAHAACRKASKAFKNGGRQLSSASKVTAKLEALKNLIPAKAGEVVKPDQLFEETADYIVRLRNQVFVLQKLIQLYGSAQRDDLVSS